MQQDQYDRIINSQIHMPVINLEVLTRWACLFFKQNGLEQKLALEYGKS